MKEASEEFNRLCRKLWADGTKALTDLWRRAVLIYLAVVLLVILIEWIISNA